MMTCDYLRRVFRAIPLALAALLLGCLLSGCSGGGNDAAHTGAKTMSAAEADTLLKSYAKDRTDTEEWLKSKPTSYLATILRRDFGNNTSLTVGSGHGND